LRKQTGLYLLCDFDLLRGPAFSLILLNQGPALGFHTTGEFVESRKAEGVSVRIFKASVDSAPRWNLRWVTELDAAFLPCLVFAIDVFRDEPYARLGADEFPGVVTGLKERKPNVSIAVGRGHFDPALAVIESVINHHPEPQLINIESQAAIQIAHPDDDEMKAEIGIRTVESQQGSINAER